MGGYRSFLIALLGVLGGAAGATDSVSATPTTAAGNAGPTSTRAVLTGEQVIQILDQTVDWYRTLGTQQQSANQPSDLLILYANQQTASQVIALAFDIARANAELLSSEAASATSSTAATASTASQSLQVLQKRLDAQRASTQAEIDSNQRDLTAGKGNKADLEAKRSELQSELAMVGARANLLDTMAQFVTQSDAKSASANALKAHIDAIAMSVPTAGVATPVAAAAAPATSSPPAKTAAPTPATPFTSPSSAQDRLGIWDLIQNVLRLSGKLSTINAVDRRTAALEQTFHKISAAPLAQLKALSARSDQLSGQADSAHGDVLKSVRDQLDTLAWLFKQTSDIMLPLGKEEILLQQYRHNLQSWRESVQHQYHDGLGALGVRVGILLLLLAIVFAGAEVWRRLVLRYTHDPRHRYRLLLLRKLTCWTLVVLIIGLTFVTELSTFATFAGLLTAGVAVAIQSVLVSIVGYFFLIGKYGLRVGDRVQIGTVSGEVIDIGLVRMHLMELNPQGPLGATGRVVAFANSIVFQSSNGLFRQIPGVNFSWHETTLRLPDGCNYVAVKEQLLTAVTGVVKEYQDELARQTRQIEKATASNSVGAPTPQVQLRFSAAAVEALIRYPVQPQHEAEIDERVSKELLQVLTDVHASVRHG
jgi:small-conductance mechanosensitive channel